MRASSQPPPRAWPETAAMMGFLIFVRCDHDSIKDVFRAWEKVRLDISFMSAPAAKALAELFGFVRFGTIVQLMLGRGR